MTVSNSVIPPRGTPLKILAAECAVLWRNGGRVGSIQQSELPVFKESFCMSLIQRDISGCEHWGVYGVRRNLRPASPARKPPKRFL